jgi:hypothetical protein
MHILVMVFAGVDLTATPLHKFVLNYNEAADRRRLGTQCRNAFEGGQTVVTRPATPREVKRHGTTTYVGLEIRHV